MKVHELIRVLNNCHDDAEVFFEETTTRKEDGIDVGNITAVNSVYEVGTRQNEYQPWHVKRVVLSYDKD